MAERHRRDLVAGITTLQAAGMTVALWSLTPPGVSTIGDPPPVFGLTEMSRARRKLLRRLRRFLGPYAHGVQGPQIVRPGDVERLGLHVLSAGQTIEREVLSTFASASGFGSDVDVRHVDARSNTAESVGGYLSRHLSRDGYRLSEHTSRVDLVGYSRGPAWPRSER
jgi:hypothetical protein